MPPKTDAQWRAEADARVLADAAAINSDPARKKAAGTAAKRLVTDEQKRAKAQAAQAAEMQRLAAGKGGGSPPAKPKAKSPTRRQSPKPKRKR